ncbi:Transcriptional regulatory protein ZraR [Planctomycetes bacterium MalM25]|nr:Transcriptional regulatory protein ZraR [Planctomycetes bacterium MalM25]
MAKLTPEERPLLEAFSELTYCNPFEPVRIELEQAVLGDRFVPEGLDSWSRTEKLDRRERQNVVRLTELAGQLVNQLAERQQKGDALTGQDAAHYDDLVTYTLYYRHLAGLDESLLDPGNANHRLKRLAGVWRAFSEDRERLLAPLGAAERRDLPESDHLFACLHQVRRAFNAIFDYLIGESRPATRLRAQVWQSIFTHDLRRYRRTLYRCMGDLATLVTGPSGSGKELVARAIGSSQYRAFDGESGAFVVAAESGEAFIALNLSALSPTLIESELFGHHKGAFTGATGDHVGWLERCPAHGAVFLDEIGELDPAIQVKLLRVAQTRDYSRLGESKPRHFFGKLLAATNRDLATEMREGRFREDLYYRLCSDRVMVPSLQEQIVDRPEVLSGLTRFLSHRVLGGGDIEREVETLSLEVLAWIDQRLPSGYGWPGNIRELEQCVRSVLVRREYHPPSSESGPAHSRWLRHAQGGKLTAEELLNAYCRLVYERQGGYEQAARVLGLDRRTVKSRVMAASDGGGD